MSTPIYPLIPFSEIDDEARDIAVAWVDQYGNMGVDIQNKHKLASDIMNYHRNKIKDVRKEVLEECLKLAENCIEEKDASWDRASWVYDSIKELLNEIK